MNFKSIADINSSPKISFVKNVLLINNFYQKENYLTTTFKYFYPHNRKSYSNYFITIKIFQFIPTILINVSPNK